MRPTHPIAALALAAGLLAPAAGAQDPEAVRALVERFYGPYESGDYAVYDEILAPDWLDDPRLPEHPMGPAGLAASLEMFRAAVPDMSVAVEQVLVDGDWAAVRSIIRGHHDGPFLGLEPTGAPIKILAHDFHRVEDGRIAQTFHVEDITSLLWQVGALPLGPAE